MTEKHEQDDVSRRDFFKSATAATVATSSVLLLKPESALGAAANSTVELGIIGSGGRGTRVARDFFARPDVKIVAAADLYDDKLEAIRGRLEIPKSRLYKGFDAYKELLDSGVDAVLLTTPAYFHPEQFEAVVDKGKHCYLEKPVAIDAPGCRRIIEAGKKAEGKLCVTLGLQRRYGDEYTEAKRRVDNGDLGIIASGRAQWLGGDLKRDPRQPSWSEQEFQIRNWYFFRGLSGDIIIEQNVHNIDICNWFIGTHPVRAVGMGGRKARTDIGDVFDHFNIVFEYPGGVHVSFSSTQFQKGWNDVSEQLFGSKGSVDMKYGRITGENPWRFKGPRSSNFHITNAVNAFVDGIQSGTNRNDSLYGGLSTMTAVLARTAAYNRKETTWDEVYNSNETLAPKF